MNWHCQKLQLARVRIQKEKLLLNNVHAFDDACTEARPNQSGARVRAQCESRSHSAHFTALLNRWPCKARACQSARAHDIMDLCKSAWDQSTKRIPCLYIAKQTVAS